VQEASFFLAPIIRSKNHCAAFVERIPGVRTSTNKEETLTQLTNYHTAAAKSLGFSRTFHAEQIHGSKITVITKESPLISPGVDALITSENTLLGIHVADCGAL
jgi:copper oxidase (laccase) domain-containing protein